MEMNTSTTRSVYIHVIEDVVDKIRDEFLSSDGPGEVVLKDLQASWVTKMINAEVLLGPIARNTIAPRKDPPRGSAAPGHDPNVPYEGIKVYETPTADLLFHPTPVPGTADSSMHNIPTGGSHHATPKDIGGSNVLKRPTPYMQPHSPRMPQRNSPDVNVAYEEARKEGDRRVSNIPHTQDICTMPAAKRRRDEFKPNIQNDDGYIPQQDGASGFEENPNRLADASNKIPQLDGPVPTPLPPVQNDHGDDDDDDEEPLNENDDEDLDDTDNGEELISQDLVLCQFEKVSRTKNRWKCTLKAGIALINNNDILFNKAFGEFNF